jgi:RNA polymerase sigma factor (sigma-70 family)
MKATTNGILNRVRNLLQRADPTPDAELLARFVADRDPDAFALLVRRHGPMVHGVCRRVLRNLADADDAFQATFLVLARRAGVVRPQGLLGNWLYGIAYRTALEARRAAAVRRARERRAAEMRTQAAEENTQSPDLREALDRELAALPDVYRAAIVLCDLEGLPRKDAAERLGWREGTLSGRLFRARSLLAARLARLGLAVPAAGLGAVATASAALPPALAESTIRIGVLVAAGDAAVVAAAPVVALSEGVMKAMLLTKLKGLATSMVVGCAVLTTAVAGWQANAVGASSTLVDGQARSQPQARSAQRDPDKERIAQLERERDELLKVVRDLQTRLEKLEADRKNAFRAKVAEGDDLATLEGKLKQKAREVEREALRAEDLAKLRRLEEQRARLAGERARSARNTGQKGDDGGPPAEVLDKLRKLEEEFARQARDGDKAKMAEMAEKMKAFRLDAERLARLKELGGADLADKLKAMDFEKLAKLKALDAEKLSSDLAQKLKAIELGAEQATKLRALEAEKLAKLKAKDAEKLAKKALQEAQDRFGKVKESADRSAELEARVKALEADIKKLLAELERQRKNK